MDPQIKGAIIGGICTLLAAIIPIAHLAIKNVRLRRNIKYVTPGMAVAYYFGFMKKLFAILKNPERMHIVHEHGKVRISKSNTKLEIILPKSLTVEGFEHTKQLIMERYTAGEIRKGNETLLKAILFREEHNNAYIILDLPSILESASAYYNDSSRNPDYTGSERWKKLNQKELSYFEEAIKRMVKNSLEMDERVEIRIID